MRALHRVHLPDETEAGERTWEVVRSAYQVREPLPRAHRRARPLLLAATALAIVAAAVSSPGRAVLGSLRETIGVKRAAPELFRLPGAGRLLVRSDTGPWLVQPNGSKRLLVGWRDAAWSPHGIYVVASRPNE